MSSKHFTAEGLLVAPPRPAHLPPEAQWLAGVGAGSWFVLHPKAPWLYAERYNPEGRLECKGLFAAVDKNQINWQKSFAIDYISHCAQVCLRQNENLFLFRKTTTGEKTAPQK